MKVFSFKKRAKRHIPKIDALTFADLLSKSNHSTLADSQKMWAQEIVTMLHYLYPDDPTVTYMTGVVLANLGNYQGQKLIDSTFDGIDALSHIWQIQKRLPHNSCGPRQTIYECPEAGL